MFVTNALTGTSGNPFLILRTQLFLLFLDSQMDGGMLHLLCSLAPRTPLLQLPLVAKTKPSMCSSSQRMNSSGALPGFISQHLTAPAVLNVSEYSEEMFHVCKAIDNDPSCSRQVTTTDGILGKFLS